MGISDRMPVLFIGHGSPMNAIEDNTYTRTWVELGAKLPKPKAILAVSAHWFTKGSRVNDSSSPKMIYDMYGFPKELYEVKYQPAGAPELAGLTKELIQREVIVDNGWGIDHGTWSVLYKMYPQADIPVYQLSIDRGAGAKEHYQMGQELKRLREMGVLILGSGNVVHNLSMVQFEMESGFPWALEFDRYVQDNILSRNYENVIHYQRGGKSAELAFYTPEHFYPLLYILGAAEAEDRVTVFNDTCTMGSLSMTGYLFEA